MFRLRSQYARHGLAVHDWRKRSDDHLVVQLQFVAHLLSVPGNGLRDAAHFLDEHLLRWIPEFARRVAGRCDTAFYGGLAMLTAAYLDELRELLGQILGEPRPTAEEVEARFKSKVSVEAPPPRYIPGPAPSW
jgi:TorA maturation chaperone TorD